jgi:hypothetical protein
MRCYVHTSNVLRNEEASGSIPLSSTNLCRAAAEVVLRSLGEGGPFARLRLAGHSSRGSLPVSHRYLN